MSEIIRLEPNDAGLRKLVRTTLAGIARERRRRFDLPPARNGTPGRVPDRILSLAWIADASKDLAGIPPRLRGCWRGYVLFTGGLPPEAWSRHVLPLRVRDPARLQLIPAATSREAGDFLAAFLHRLSLDGHELVLHAWWDRDELQILTTRFRLVGVPASKLGRLARAGADARRRMEVGFDGTYVHWPDLDLHVGVDNLAEWIDPAHVLREKQREGGFNRRYGEAIRALRERAGLRQTDVAGLTARQVGRIERGECRVTRTALAKLAQAHKLDPAAYLKALAEGLEAA